MIGYIVFFGSLFLIQIQIKSESKKLILFFLIVTLFSAIRYGIGYDYFSYLECCFPGSNRGELFEPIPRFFVHLSQEIFPFLFFILSSIFISFFYFLAIRNEGQDHYLEVLFYICFPFLFFNQLGIVRQAMASSVIFYAITLKSDNRLGVVVKLLLILLAWECHHSAIVSLLILFPWQRVSPKYLWAMFLASFFLGVTMTEYANQFALSGFLDEDTSERALKYLNREGQTEGNIIKYLIYLIALFSLLFYKKLVRFNKRNAYYVGLLVVGASFFALFDYNVSLAKRFCMFFFSTAIFIVPQIFKIQKVPNYLYVSICILLFSVNIYVSSSNVRFEDREGESVSFPYRTYIFNNF